MASRYEYADRPREEVQRRAKQRSGRYDSYLTKEVTWFKAKNGENCLRILPWIFKGHERFKPLVERWTLHWGLDIFVHFQVGADNGAYLCVDKMLGQPCPICDAWKSEGIDALAPAHRILCRVIDRNNEKEGPMFWSMPLSVSNDISAASEIKSRGAAEGQVLVIDDWDKGHDVYFDKEGEKDRTRYKRIAVDPQPSYLCENETTQDKWLDEIFSDPLLPDMLKFYEPEYLEKVLSGQKDRSDESDGANVRGASDRGARRRRPDDGAAAGDREEHSSRRPLQREADDSERASTRRPVDDDSRATSRGGDREERATRGRGSEDTASPRDRLPEAEEQTRGDPPWKTGRDREAETANEGREAASSREGSGRTALRDNLKESVGRNRRG